MIAMSRHPLPGHTECPICADWYEGSPVRVWTGLDNLDICPNCARYTSYTVREFCTACHDWMDSSVMRDGLDGERYCKDCWIANYFTCEGCGEVYNNDDMGGREDGCYCHECSRQSYSDGWCAATFRGRESYNRMRSPRKYGIELETNSCDDYHELSYRAAWGAKTDGTVYGMEFVSPILWGDDGFSNISDICDFAASNGWEVGDNCGYHAHFDMRGESVDSMKAIVCAYYLTYEVWSAFVDQNRINGRYSRAHRATISEVYSCAEWTRFCCRSTRYEWFNVAAYTVHDTFEVRSHQGTLDESEICNWINAHATFMDWASKAGWAKVRNTLLCMNNADKMDFMCKVWRDAGCADLAEYYSRKACANHADWARDEVYA